MSSTRLPKRKARREEILVLSVEGVRHRYHAVTAQLVTMMANGFTMTRMISLLDSRQANG